FGAFSEPQNRQPLLLETRSGEEIGPVGVTLELHHGVGTFGLDLDTVAAGIGDAAVDQQRGDILAAKFGRRVGVIDGDRRGSELTKRHFSLEAARQVNHVAAVAGRIFALDNQIGHSRTFSNTASDIGAVRAAGKINRRWSGFRPPWASASALRATGRTRRGTA